MVVGLGNPGRAYKATRHNAGWMVLDEFASRRGAAFHKAAFRPVETATASLDGAGNLLLVKPLTYMNESGTVLPALMRKNGVEPKDLVVVLDDVSLPLGKLRIRAGGSAGGHHGLESVIEHGGSPDIPRLRVGILTEKREGRDLKDYVLEPVGQEELQLLRESVARAADALECLLAKGIDTAMNTYN